MNIVWWNGKSRQDLTCSLPLQLIEAGCNYIRRDRDVKIVCAFDDTVIKRIQEEKDVHYFTIAERARLPMWQCVHDPLLRGTNSGLIAIRVVQHINRQPVYVIGCDWGINTDSVYEAEYGSEGTRKYTNGMKRVLDIYAQTSPIIFVNDAKPDVNQPVISKIEFLSKIL